MKNKLIYGVGVNDWHGKVKENGRIIKSYVNWFSMLRRCYDASTHISRPTYKDCLTREDWWSFSSYKSWHDAEFFEGAQVDKDILVPNNKEYSKDACVMVPDWLNSLLHAQTRKQDCPLGVVYKGDRVRRYVSEINYKGVRKCLGSFYTPEEAHRAWQQEKVTIILEAAYDYSKGDYVKPFVIEALQRKAEALRIDSNMGNITTTFLVY